MNEIHILYAMTFTILIYVGWSLGIIKAQLKDIEQKIEKGE
jgi:hypothetical protein